MAKDIMQILLFKFFYPLNRYIQTNNSIQTFFFFFKNRAEKSVLCFALFSHHSAETHICEKALGPFIIPLCLEVGLPPGYILLLTQLQLQ